MNEDDEEHDKQYSKNKPTNGENKGSNLNRPLLTTLSCPSSHH